MADPFIVTTNIFTTSEGQRVRIVSVGEFQPDDNLEDSFVLYSWRAYVDSRMIPYTLTDDDKIHIAEEGIKRGREYLDRNLAGRQISALASLGGRSTSPRKAAAARENGRKSGGRPRKKRE